MTTNVLTETGVIKTTQTHTRLILKNVKVNPLTLPAGS